MELGEHGHDLARVVGLEDRELGLERGQLGLELREPVAQAGRVGVLKAGELPGFSVPPRHGPHHDEPGRRRRARAPSA